MTLQILLLFSSNIPFPFFIWFNGINVLKKSPKTMLLSNNFFLALSRPECILKFEASPPKSVPDLRFSKIFSEISQTGTITRWITMHFRITMQRVSSWRIFWREGRCNGSNKSRSWSLRGWFIRYQPSWHRPTAICSEDGSLHDPCRLSSCRRFLSLRYLKRNVSTWLRIATELDEIAFPRLRLGPGLIH